ncbi:hypothetical protein AAF712_013537 [Marasmius tenuissimus]|uniref:Uncharacterized protein n=1 Tax=Marasmius tenuissimus TaxID=585030 RepID=A0ABR2ZEQ7_9AGAR
MDTEHQREKAYVLPSAEATGTKLNTEVLKLRERVYTLEQRNSSLDAGVKELEVILERLERDERVLSDMVQKAEAEVKQLEEDCDFLLNFVPVTVLLMWRRHHEAYQAMRTAIERVMDLEGKIKRGELHEAGELPEVANLPESSKSRQIRAKQGTMDPEKHGAIDWFEGPLTPLDSPPSSPAESRLDDEVSVCDCVLGRMALTARQSEDARENSREDDRDDAMSEKSREGFGIEREMPQTQDLVLVPLPADGSVPDWFKRAFHSLNVSIGDRYSELVGHWVTIERLKGWKTRARGLAASSRPQEVNRFLGKGKLRWEYGPAIEEKFVGIFSRRVREWWVSLVKTSGELNRGGQNGWCLLLVCMKWWATGIADVEDDKERERAERDWETMLEEMNKAAQVLITFLEAERAAENES